jgi:hypothetical protein
MNCLILTALSLIDFDDEVESSDISFFFNTKLEANKIKKSLENLIKLLIRCLT